MKAEHAYKLAVPARSEPFEHGHTTYGSHRHYSRISAYRLVGWGCGWAFGQAFLSLRALCSLFWPNCSQQRVRKNGKLTLLCVGGGGGGN